MGHSIKQNDRDTLETTSVYGWSKGDPNGTLYNQAPKLIWNLWMEDENVMNAYETF